MAINWRNFHVNTCRSEDRRYATDAFLAVSIETRSLALRHKFRFGA
jgi:hypothetical protein